MRKGWLIIVLCLACTLTACSAKKEQPVEAIQEVLEEKIEVYGEVTVANTEEIRLDFPGIIEEVHIKEGQKVKKGDPLITLNLEDYKAQLAMKENQLAIYELQLKQLKENINPQTANMQQLRDELTLKEMQLNNKIDPDIQSLEKDKALVENAVVLARRDYEASKEIFATGGISERELMTLEQMLKVKQKEKEALELSLKKVRTNKQLEIDNLKAQIQSGQAQLGNLDKQTEMNIEVLKVQIQTASIELQNMKGKLNKPYMRDNVLVAMQDDLVAYDIACQKGSRLEVLVGPMMKMMDMKSLVVTIDIPEEYIDEVVLGDEVEIIPYTNQEKTIKGKVSRISERAVEEAGETVVKAEVTIEEDTELLKPGVTVDAKI